MQSSPQNDFLNIVHKERKPVEVYLLNGVRLVGSIALFDRFVVVLSATGGMQAIYKSAISTIQFQGPVRQSGSIMRTARDEALDKETEAPRANLCIAPLLSLSSPCMRPAFVKKQRHCNRRVAGHHLPMSSLSIH